MRHDQLDSYRLVDIIGAGSFASVYRAVDERLDDTVAIKLLAENHSLNPDIRARFIAEGRSLRKVRGGFAISVYEIGESDQHQPYLVLELADRGTLRQRVEQLWAQGWTATRQDLLDFARATAAAVGAIHDAGLVHRDLSPGNLLLTSAPRESSIGQSHVIGSDERLVVADLGMCKDLALNSGLTVAGGTEGFRPPEQDDLGIVDSRADIWAMTALLKWVSQGSPNAPALRHVIKRGTAAKPRQRHADTRMWLQEIEAALQPAVPSQADRPAEAAAHGNANSAGQTSTTQQTPHKGNGNGRWLRHPLTVGILVLALAIGGVAGYAIPGGVTTPPSQSATSSLAISGPDHITVGQAAQFTADIQGVDSWVWTLPNHRQIADEKRVAVTATGAGDGTVILRAQSADGRDLEVRHTVHVTD